MSSPRHPAIRLSAPLFAIFFVGMLAIILLVGRRLDAPWAGGTGSGSHHDATFVDAKTLDGSIASLPQTLARGETVTTDANTFAAYTLNETCNIYLAENSSLTLEDGRETFNTFNLLTGRAVAEGDCTFITRETTVHTTGTATLVHFSWLNELVVKTLKGGTIISQSGNQSAFFVAEDVAVRFFTLPNISHSEPSDLSLTENPTVEAFYSWSINP